MSAPEAAARQFVDAVVWGEHSTVWDLLGPEAKRTVLRVAVERGMDELAVARLRDGVASDREREDYLTDLVNGLREDLAGSEVDRLAYEVDPEPPGPGRARVVLVAPLPEILGGGIPAASVELAEHQGRWVVERLVPRRTE